MSFPLIHNSMLVLLNRQFCRKICVVVKRGHDILRYFGEIHQCDGGFIISAATTTPSFASRNSTCEVTMENNTKVNRSCFVFLLILFGITLTLCGANPRAFNNNSKYTYTNFCSFYWEMISVLLAHFYYFKRHNNK